MELANPTSSEQTDENQEKIPDHWRKAIDH